MTTNPPPWDDNKWSIHQQPSYQWSNNPTLIPPPQPKRNNWWVWVLIVIVVLFGIGACTAIVTSDNSTMMPVPPVDSSIPVLEENPLTDDGTYLVGLEIQPGTYRVNADDTVLGKMGYWARCADPACVPGDGMIENALVTSDGSFLVIKSTDYSVELNDLELIPQ